jgi:hypothetical protein
MPDVLRFDDAMTEMETSTDRGALVPAAHRLIRAIGSADGPFSGALVGYDDGVAVCLDVDALDGWGGWAHAGHEHVCGVLDVRRRADGHDALVPWCTQRVETFLGRRRSADEPLSAGELGTLVVSLLRGIRELGHEDTETCGDWWLTGDGRPLFVIGEGGGARGATAALIGRILEHTADRPTTRVLDEIANALRERRHHVDDDMRWEQELLGIAAPRALRLDVFAPERAADLAPDRSTRIISETAPRLRARTSIRRPDAGGPRAVVRAAAAALTDRIVALRARAERRPSRRHPTPPRQGESARPSPRGSHRRPLILAGSLAAAVLAAGLMWPQGEDVDQARAAPITVEPEGALGPKPSSPGKDADESARPRPTPTGDDALSAVPELLDAIAECVEVGAATCPSALVDGLGTPEGGAVVSGSQGSTATLVDDYGDVAVIRISAVDEDSGEAEQMLVLERREEKWLVRAVYDVAHQPD